MNAYQETSIWGHLKCKMSGHPLEKLEEVYDEEGEYKFSFCPRCGAIKPKVYRTSHVTEYEVRIE